MREDGAMWICPHCRKESEDNFDVCWSCGTARDGTESRDFVKGDAVEAEVARPAVSSLCPACGGSTYRTTAPAAWVAFTSDRVCLACKTRYTPPTPRWAGLLFVAAGALLIVPAVVGVVWRVFAGNIATIPGMCIETALAVAGVLSLAHGWRSLRSPGTV